MKVSGVLQTVLRSKLLNPFLILLNIYAFHLSLAYKQCCDADSYIQESIDISKVGFIPGIGESSWLSINHNYLYSIFIHSLNAIGLSTRFEIGIVQLTLILFANLAVSYRFSKVFVFEWNRAFSILLIGNLLAVYSYSGFTLTEALATVFITAWIALIFEFLAETFRGNYSFKLFVVLNFSAGAAWMTRPALIWIPMVTVAIGVSSQLVALKPYLQKFLSAFRLLITSISVLSIVALPQLLITKNNQGFVSGVFKLGVWQWHHVLEVTSYRYITNLSGCGPVALIFSPYTQTFEGVWPAKFHSALNYSILDFISSFVSGWDAVPSPLVYINHLSIFPWILLTLVSGFLISLPFLAFFQSLKNPLYYSYKWTNLGIMLVFIVSQLSVAFTHGEFRFNIAGWIIGIMNLLYGIANKFWGINRAHYLAISIAISFFIVTVGQMTLALSSAWINCVAG